MGGQAQRCSRFDGQAIAHPSYHLVESNRPLPTPMPDATSPEGPSVNESRERASGGVRISRGVRLRFPPGGLIVHTRGDMRLEVAKLELQLDTCVHWLEIAIDSLDRAQAAHQLSTHSVSTTPSGSDDPMDREFKASLEATIASATFFEALHAAVLERLPKAMIPTTARKARRSPRYARVTEVLRRGFGLRKQGTANLRSVLKEIYRFRDQAVHPTAAFSEPILHPQLLVGVERRFVMFSFASARQLVRAALAFSKILPSRDLSKQPKDIQEFAQYLVAVCDPLYARWQSVYGELLDTLPSGT